MSTHPSRNFGTSPIIKLLVSKSFQEKTQQDTIFALNAMGLGNNLIAEILSIKSSIVRASLSQARKKGKRKGSKGGK
jgi:hypothetical protein